MKITYTINMLMLLAGTFFVSACEVKNESKAAIVDTIQSTTKNDPRHQCVATENSRNAYCEVSVYELASSPQRFDGMYLTFVAYVPESRSPIIFFTKDAAEYEDYQSAILVDEDDKEELTKAGYARFFAQFNHDRSDYGFAVGFGRQLGYVREIEKVRYIRPISERKKECETEGCTVDYIRSGNR
jgi:hypothetical protein